MIQKIAAFAVLALALVSQPAWTQGKEASAAKEPAGGTLTVSEAKLGTSVEAKQLVGEATTFDLNQKVYLWLELKGGPADDITVTWKTGEKSYPTTLKVGGPTYHTWAYKTAAIAGSWSVTVSDSAGKELKQLEFTVGAKTAK